jgi:hypothetical protein
MFWNKTEESVVFKCEPRLKGVIPEPYPAKRYIPEWYKKLVPYAAPEKGTITPIPTLKRCPPFLDAMCAGWIIPLAADVHISVRDKGSGVTWETDFIWPIVQSHRTSQVITHPSIPKHPLKFLNWWMVQTPPGWSTLFISPINRTDDKLELMAGIVDTDNFHEYVNFPGFIKMESGVIKLESGYPLMQAIPFKRGYNTVAKIQEMTEEDEALYMKHRDRHSASFSHYRDNVWEKKV